MFSGARAAGPTNFMTIRGRVCHSRVMVTLRPPFRDSLPQCRYHLSLLRDLSDPQYRGRSLTCLARWPTGGTQAFERLAGDAP